MGARSCRGEPPAGRSPAPAAPRSAPRIGRVDGTGAPSYANGYLRRRRCRHRLAEASVRLRGIRRAGHGRRGGRDARGALPRWGDGHARLARRRPPQPKGHAQECDQAARWLATPWVIDGVHVEVDDVDAHYERARAAGATILREPEALPFGRLYSAADLEGHRWMFMQPSS